MGNLAMNIYEILNEIERAYPEDIFPDTTQGEIDDVAERYPGFIDRTSAAMGRHLVQVIRRKLAKDGEDEVGELVEAAEKVYQLRNAMRGANGPSALIIALAMIDLHKAAEKVRQGMASKPPDVGK